MVDAVYRSDSRRVLATLIRLLGDFDLAEEALHDAFTAAVERWPRDGVPANPRAWLVSAGRFKAIDAMRRRARFDASLEEIARRFDVETSAPAARDERSEEHTSELQSHSDLVCRLLLEKKKNNRTTIIRSNDGITTRIVTGNT